jgi:hypothetical protein
MSPALGWYQLDTIIAYSNKIIEGGCLSIVPIIPVLHEKFLQSVSQEMLFRGPSFQLMKLGKQPVDLIIKVMEVVVFHQRYDVFKAF